MKLKDDIQSASTGANGSENKTGEDLQGPEAGANLVKNAVEEALSVAESVALTSTGTPVLPAANSYSLNLSVSLREIVEQVEEYLAPEVGAERLADPEESEDLDELEIEAEIGRPTSTEEFERPKKLAVEQSWSSEPTREVKLPVARLDTEAVAKEQRGEDLAASVPSEGGAHTGSVSVRDSMVDDAMDSALLPRTVAGESARVTSRMPPPVAATQGESSHVPTWETAQETGQLTGWESDAETMRYRLQDKLAFHAEGSYFEVLELPVDAGRDEIENSYRMLAHQFDLGLYQRLGLAELEEGIKTVQSSLAQAHEMLTNDRVREEYRKALVSEE